MKIEMEVWYFVLLCIICISALSVTLIACIKYRIALNEEKKRNLYGGKCIGEISIESIVEQLNDQLFLEMVKSYCDNKYESTEAIKTVNNGIVEVRMPCVGTQFCIAFPDRLDEVGCDGNGCKGYINLNKLCGVECSCETKRQENILTEAEVKQLTDIVVRLNKEQ